MAAKHTQTIQWSNLQSLLQHLFQHIHWHPTSFTSCSHAHPSPLCCRTGSTQPATLPSLGRAWGQCHCLSPPSVSSVWYSQQSKHAIIAVQPQWCMQLKALGQWYMLLTFQTQWCMQMKVQAQWWTCNRVVLLLLSHCLYCYCVSTVL